METNIAIPNSLIQAVKCFSDPAVAFQFVKQWRWPDDIVTCPFCQNRETSFLSTRQSWKCKSCKKQFGIKTRTVFQGSPLPLDKWLLAFWLMGNCKNGISSYELAATLGISQTSAWYVG